ncbi:MAG: DUF3352 domain-containing protein [Solirubrobacteraceae bacterium]
MPGHPDQRPRARRGVAPTLLTTLILSAAIAGCGSSHATGTSADPASVVPASTPLYAGANVRPEGALKAAASTAGRTLTHEADPYLGLVAILQTPGSAPLNFDRDVAGWLGPRAGIFVSSLGTSGQSNTGQLLSQLARGLLGSSGASAFPFAGGPSGVQGAIVMDTSDVGVARSFLASQARRAGAQAATYRGVSYEATSAGLAFAVVGRFAVIGSEGAVHSVIETTLGGSSLAQSPGYAKLLSVAPSGALAHVFSNPAALPANSQTRTGLLGALGGTDEANISLVPSTSSIGVDADELTTSSSSSGGLLASVSQGAQAAGQLPGESWLIVGLGNVGATLGGDVQGLRELASLGSSLSGSGTEAATSSPLNLKSLLEGILTPLSVLGANSAEARRDFASWMGPAGIFASGTGLAELRAGIVIDSTNPALSAAAVARLGALLRRSGVTVQAASYPGAQGSIAVYLNGLPLTLNIVNARDAQGQTKFVIGLGEPSVTTALNPPNRWSGSGSYNAAGAVLGEGIQPSLSLDFPTFVGLLEAVGLGEGPTISKLLPAARTLTMLSGGGKSLGGGIERFRMVVGLQQTG